MALSDLPLWFIRTFGVLFGLLWGSFLNVVIYRLPRGMNVAFPPSHCPGCGKPIAPYDNIPVFSYVILGGRARCCKTKMSPRYPLVELIGGALAFAILERMLIPHANDLGMGRAGAIFLADLMLCLGLVAAAFIDAEHMFLPDSITLGGAVLGLGTASLRNMTYLESAKGAVIGFLVVWFPLVFLYSKLRGRAGMGMGDAKLTLLAGAWFGWPGALFVLFAGAFQGTIGAVLIYLVKGRIEEPEAVKKDREELQKAASEGDEEAKAILAEDPLADAPGEGLAAARMPFGPFLILACLEFLFYGPEIAARYQAFVNP
ncbi:MAG: prepilin peptidase [Polyangiaceae bacterium]